MRGEPVQEILAVTPLHFAAGHHVFHRVIQQVCQRVLAVLKRVCPLTVAVLDVDASSRQCWSSCRSS